MHETEFLTIQVWLTICPSIFASCVTLDVQTFSTRFAVISKPVV